MKYVIVSGSFKDVFSPMEACNMIEQAIPAGNEVKKIPFCDGGEYTFEVLSNANEYNEVCVDNVFNPYLKIVTAKYLIKDGQAHIISSEILRLHPQEDEEKNPLELTDYGYGQLIKHAISSGYKEIYLYWGGTSTVCGGIGCAQALGVKFFDKNGCLMKKPIRGRDLIDIDFLKTENVKYDDLNIHVIVDGDAKLYEMQSITQLKIGKIYRDQSDVIIRQIDDGIKNIARVCNIDENKSFSGAAGGLLIGTELCFTPKYILGGDYFSELFHVADTIKECDCVLTGEGRYDNSTFGKAPVFAVKMAKEYHKKTILICGQIDQKLYSDISSGIIRANKKNLLSINGIDMILTCQFFYDQFSPKGSYEEDIQYYRENTANVVKKLFQQIEPEING